jgi:hypothetical protein
MTTNKPAREFETAIRDSDPREDKSEKAPDQ